MESLSNKVDADHGHFEFIVVMEASKTMISWPVLQRPFF